jgi:putative lipoprotein
MLASAVATRYMHWMVRGLLAGLATCSTCVLLVSSAWADTPDPWFGKDKALHFTATAVIGAGGYALGAALFEPRYQAMLLGAGAGIVAGAGKELADLAGLGDPSWRDFVWDVVGTVVGVGLAWGIDLAVRGTGKQHPVLGSNNTLMLSW